MRQVDPKSRVAPQRGLQRPRLSSNNAYDTAGRRAFWSRRSARPKLKRPSPTLPPSKMKPRTVSPTRWEASDLSQRVSSPVVVIARQWQPGLGTSDKGGIYRGNTYSQRERPTLLRSHRQDACARPWCDSWCIGALSRLPRSPGFQKLKLPSLAANATSLACSMRSSQSLRCCVEGACNRNS